MIQSEGENLTRKPMTDGEWREYIREAIDFEFSDDCLRPRFYNFISTESTLHSSPSLSLAVLSVSAPQEQYSCNCNNKCEEEELRCVEY